MIMTRGTWESQDSHQRTDWIQEQRGPRRLLQKERNKVRLTMMRRINKFPRIQQDINFCSGFTSIAYFELDSSEGVSIQGSI